MEEYIHHEKDPDFIFMMANKNGSITTDEQIIPYEGRRLVALQRYNGYGYYFVVVPGFILNSRTNEHKKLASDVEPVDKSRQADITKLLREMDFRGSVNFWGMDEEK